ncbi:M1 family metallopeptidase [Nocardioides sp. BP30]|uniref:M1 family metallopeptidase n=1 Tax=Nocardioides sp. BP30 TaxID=3036374 RepID=UPI002469901D|nr:M1 family metallopeptidase [Nocardioides sp. BP30]WGL53521.1 M1 family metallopeptidase [Nocardioides sp. BP30]
MINLGAARGRRARARHGRRYRSTLALAATTALVGSLSGTPALAGSAAASVPAGYGAAVSTPRIDSYYPAHGNDVVDALHYGLNLTWHPRRRSLAGTETLVFRAAKDAAAIPLDLSNALTVTAAAVDGHAVAATRSTDHVSLPVRVAAGQVHTVTLSYAGRPQPVAAPGTRSDESVNGFISKRDGRAYAMQEPYGAFTWYAVNDQPADKALYDFTLHVPAPFVSIANGRLTHRRTRHGVTTTRWHLASPAASYLATVAFGDYRETKLGKVHGTPLSYWTPTDRPALVRQLRFMKKDFRWLERLLGRYPFATLSLVVVPSKSAMETQTMISEGSDRYALAEDNVVHEMSHQWWGDQVTPNDWRDVWMSEGMAMYIQYRWLDHVDHYPTGTWVSYETSREDDMLLSKYGPPGAYNRADFGSSNIYLPPARMWWKLSESLGRSRFDTLLRGWTASHPHSSQSRETLEDWWSTASGRDLHSFFQGWLLATEDPS